MLLTKELWHPAQQEWGANYSIKLDRIPRQWFRLDGDGAYKHRFRGGYGFVLRDSGYNSRFGGYGMSTTAVNSLYHEVEAIYQGLKAVRIEDGQIGFSFSVTIKKQYS